MRTKRNTRNKLNTQAFFGQSPACTCPHIHGSIHTPFNPEATTGMTYTEISRQIHATTQAFGAATRCLDGTHTVNENNDVEVAARSEEIDTFELRELEQCVAHYDEMFQEFESVEENIILLTSEKVDATADDKEDITKRIEAIAKKIHIRQASTNALIDSFICAVQFFNVEKKFNFMMEGFEEIARQHETCHRVDSPPLPSPTLTQKFNDPTKLLLEEARERKEPRPRKRLSIEAAMLSIKRQCKLAIKDIQVVNKSVNYGYCPSVLTSNVVTPRSDTLADIPDNVRRALCDFEFVYDEIVDSREKTTRLRDHVRCTMMIWVSTGKDAWEYGKTHIHEFPDMRYYEYLRVELGALYVVWLREEATILRYCEDKGGPQSLGLTPKLEEALDIRNQTWEGVERDWEASSQKLKTFLSSVEDMVKQLEGIDIELKMETHESGDDWWKVFMPECKRS